jgi:tRNA(Arg) A34 adenosine deaminase TadA
MGAAGRLPCVESGSASFFVGIHGISGQVSSKGSNGSAGDGVERSMMGEALAIQEPMALALALAKEAAEQGEVPVGAVLVEATSGTILAAAGNRTEQACDPTAHAEMLVLRQGAEKLQTARLTTCDIYVTLEPCAMCAAAIAWARIRRLYFAAYDPKGGGVEHGSRVFSQPTCHHRPEVYGGLGEEPARKLLTAFFADRRPAGGTVRPAGDQTRPPPWRDANGR